MSDPNITLAFFLGGTELMVIGVAALLLLFGGKRIPELARSVGRSVVEFKAGLKEGDKDSDPTSESKTKASSGDQEPS